MFDQSFFFTGWQTRTFVWRRDLYATKKRKKKESMKKDESNEIQAIILFRILSSSMFWSRKYWRIFFLFYFCDEILVCLFYFRVSRRNRYAIAENIELRNRKTRKKIKPNSYRSICDRRKFDDVALLGSRDQKRI